MTAVLWPLYVLGAVFTLYIVVMCLNDYFRDGAGRR